MAAASATAPPQAPTMIGVSLLAGIWWPADGDTDGHAPVPLRPSSQTLVSQAQGKHLMGDTPFPKYPGAHSPQSSPDTPMEQLEHALSPSQPALQSQVVVGIPVDRLLPLQMQVPWPLHCDGQNVGSHTSHASPVYPVWQLHVPLPRTPSKHLPCPLQGVESCEPGSMPGHAVQFNPKKRGWHSWQPIPCLCPSQHLPVPPPRSPGAAADAGEQYPPPLQHSWQSQFRHE